ncbi:Rrf2 family transcriptional regulator [bacterium]|nr:Rrf2 family transcriptional regulator [bacterium]MBU1635852.1 Rrf2 family transcriptional regulator [bacterium]MBU1873473.1 Rrf2 family transcriptional regulator [bacterium]
MRLSTRGRYGTRLMLQLAQNYKNGPVLLKDIALKEDISTGYLEHLLPPLKAIGLVSATRGAHGGYTLAKPPSEISLRDIVQSLEGSLSPVECLDTPSVCSRVQRCVSRDIWKLLRDSIYQTLESKTLEDLITLQKEKSSHMYYI